MPGSRGVALALRAWQLPMRARPACSLRRACAAGAWLVVAFTHRPSSNLLKCCPGTTQPGSAAPCHAHPALPWLPACSASSGSAGLTCCPRWASRWWAPSGGLASPSPPQVGAFPAHRPCCRQSANLPLVLIRGVNVHAMILGLKRFPCVTSWLHCTRYTARGGGVGYCGCSAVCPPCGTAAPGCPAEQHSTPLARTSCLPSFSTV